MMDVKRPLPLLPDAARRKTSPRPEPRAKGGRGWRRLETNGAKPLQRRHPSESHAVRLRWTPLGLSGERATPVALMNPSATGVARSLELELLVLRHRVEGL